MEIERKIADSIETLVEYANKNIKLREEDLMYVRNNLLSFFDMKMPGTKFEYTNVQTEVIDVLVDYAIESGIAKNNDKLLFETKLLGMVTPMPSTIVSDFDILSANCSTKVASEYLFELSKANNYIRLSDIAKNVMWKHKGIMGEIDVTINLAKPEKTPEEISLAQQAKTGYPACVLCPSNVGFEGNASHPARQTLRTIPLALTGEKWAMQFSPYQYYDQHIIVFSEEHRPMVVDRNCLKRLLEFVRIYPHYFIGSNAALPIVGGSILSHDHYQGGSKVLPMMKAPVRAVYKIKGNDNVKIGIVDWYNSVIRVEGENFDMVLEIANYILTKWNSYTDKTVDIIHKTAEQHNAVTPIARKEGENYVMDMILRNNRTDNERPYGIYHPTEDMHNIKKEGIGIIEVMGTFILPGRLSKELADISKYLTGELALDFVALSDPNNYLNKHLGVLLQLINDYGTKNEAVKAKKAVESYVNIVCEKILECTGVFKNDTAGKNAFSNFIVKELGFTKIKTK